MKQHRRRATRPSPKIGPVEHASILAGATVCAIAPAAAATTARFPDFHSDPAEQWASRVLLWALVLALAFAVVTVVRVIRGRLDGASGRGLVVGSIVFLPVFCTATGGLLVFPRAERVEFCGSCHGALEHYVQDMRRGSGDGLAALHFRNQYIATNQCYECHTSYGLFGTMVAKVNGIQQVMRYYTGTYDRPLEMWRPYRNAECLKCHAESAKWRSHEEHMSEDLVTNQVSCMDCHERGHNVDRLSMGGAR